MLLTSKYSLPDCPERAVIPEQPLQSVLQADDIDLVYINAPAGFGKTTFVAKWVESIEWPVAWVSLDETDNEIGQLAGYLVASLNYATGLSCVQSEKLIHQGKINSLDPIIQSLINEIEEFSEPLLIVLDDFHHIHNSNIHDAINRFLSYSPAGVTLVMTSRQACPFPIADLRVGQKLLELGQADLSLSKGDVKKFLDQQWPFAVSEPELMTVMELTEGWPTGAQLISMTVSDQDELGTLLEELQQGHCHLIDYLSEEVMQQLDKDVSDFLLAISVLNRFNAHLAKLLSGRLDSQDLLEKLEREGVFIVPLDRTRSWYRFHSLFHSFLEHEAKSRSKDIKSSHLLASQAWLEEGYALEALKHAVAGDDRTLVVELLTTYGYEAYQKGQLRVLVSSFEYLDDHTIMEHDELFLLSLELARYNCDYDRVGKLHRQVVKRLESPEDTNGFVGRCSAILALNAMNLGQMETANKFASVALQYVPEHYTESIATARMVMGASEFCSGKLDKAYEAIRTVEHIARQEDANTLVFYSLCVQSDILSAKGQLHSAFNVQSKALKFAKDRHLLAINDMTFVYRLRAQLYWEWHRLEDTESIINKSFDLNHPRGERFYLLDYALRLHLEIARGGAENCAYYVGKMTQLLAEEVYHRDWYANASSAMLLYWSMTDVVSEADSWLKSAPPPSSMPNHFEQKHVRNLAWANLLLGNTDDAMKMMEETSAVADRYGLVSSQNCNFILMAGIYWARDQRVDALAMLYNALQLSLETSFVSSFLILGKKLIVMLNMLEFEHDLEPPEQEKLLNLVELVKSMPKLKENASIKIDEVRLEEIIQCKALPEWFHVSPLTLREWQVFNLIHLGLTNESIARELGISPATIKTHIRHLYRKLDVNDRREAITLAEKILQEIEEK